MRPLGTRLICDHCEGMQLRLDDVAGNLGATNTIALRETGAGTGKNCPRCGGAMAMCELALDDEGPEGQFPHCPAHGIWFEAERLVRLFFHAGRTVGSLDNSMPPHRVDTKRDPKEGGRAQPFDSIDLVCPVCTGLKLTLQPRDRWACGACRGAFVENCALEGMVMEMVGQPWAMPPPEGETGERRCPVCAERMTLEQLEAVTIDRCGAHGVWFDPAELGNVLANASGDRRRGVIGWLKRVF
jgi:Zn-finger nucleic acid-binding protein